MSFRLVTLPVLVLLMTCSLPAGRALAQTDNAAIIQDLDLLAPEATASFYANRDHQAIWVDSAIIDALQAELMALDGHGLDPAHYHPELLSDWSASSVLHDIYATDAWFSAAAHMLYGKLDPISVEPDWTAARRDGDLSARLAEALETGHIAGSITELAPVQPGYQALITEYAALNQQQAEPFEPVSPGPTLRAGMSGERVSALQARLVQLELMPQDYSPGSMDPATVEAVRLFQAMNDLDDDGLAGPVTLAILNLGQQQKLDKLRVNLERWRWLPEDLGRRHVRVNIAGFNVTTWENGSQLRSHLAIVGRTYRKTPVFSDVIDYLVFNPWWEVPHSIARIDKLPEFKQNPNLVTELGYQIRDRDGLVLDAESIDWSSISPGTFPFRLRQAPGVNNALGQVKIMFPNQHNVYLHDTPAQGLYEQRQRAFSSGCIRTQFPLELSLWLLEENGDWDQARIDAVIQSGNETRVNLTVRTPVHILYFTAVAESGGGVRYLDDIYQRDSAVLDGLNATHH